MYYLSFLHWKIHELLVVQATKAHGCSSSISYHILSLTATMNWIRAIHQEEEEDMFFVEDEDEDTLVAHYLLQQEASSSHRRCAPDAQPKWPNKKDHAAGDAQIRSDYFVPDSVYSPMHFRRMYISVFYCNTKVRGNIDSILVCRFRMRPNLFLRIVQAVENVDPYFHFRHDAVGRAGLTALQKCVAIVRILAYGLPVNAVDEYVRIGESTICEALNHFCAVVINVFRQQYLRAPTPNDIARILALNEQRGWPGMLGSIDYMHWERHNCLASWKGQFTGRGKSPMMILEAVATYDLWI
jgi:hypothetical protein